MLRISTEEDRAGALRARAHLVAVEGVPLRSGQVSARPSRAFDEACIAEVGRFGMSTQLVTELTILMLAIFLGFEVISKVPTLLHTPLMSGTNAIHGIVIVGAMIIAGTPHPGWFMKLLSFLAIVLASANVVGGFVVTDRMLEMFKKRREPNEPS
jgi:NAD(P) transhydrogenase subunit alpha